MQAILLATSEQTKLAPLNEFLPAPMMPVLNRPVIEYAIEQLARHGIKDIHVALYHLGGSIEAHCGDGKRWGVRLTYHLQREPLGTAGALKWASDALTETFVMFPADALITVDFTAALAEHRARNAGVTSIVAGEMLTGAFICEPHVLDGIPARTSFDFANDLMPVLERVGEVMHRFQASEYNPLNSFADFQRAQNLGLQNKHMHARQIAPGIWVGRNAVIHPTVALAAPVCIGDDCFIGRAVELGPNVVIGANVFLDDEATLTESTVLDDTYVGKLVKLDQRVAAKTWLIDTVTCEGTRVVDHFLLAENTPTALGSVVWNVVDRFVALVWLIATLPLSILVGILTLLASGRVFAWSLRIGNRDATTNEPRRFMLAQFATANNALGKWLTTWDVHRLPEWWNVVRGDLNLVGVQPLTPEQAAQLKEDWQFKRYECRAGITGLWYTQTSAPASLEDALIADAYYVATRSWRADLAILARTPGAWWRRAMEKQKMN